MVEKIFYIISAFVKLIGDKLLKAFVILYIYIFFEILYLMILKWVSCNFFNLFPSQKDVFHK